ncbi:MAG: CBS domain-containing protein [Janthinobacterium lividum]
MRVSDILKVKGSALYTVPASTTFHDAVMVMAEHDIGSVVVIEHGEVVGMLTFREVVATLNANGGSLGETSVRALMDEAFLSCTPEMHIDELRRLMLERHARYLPVLDNRRLMGVISLFDVARAVVEAQGFENRMLKAYIRDWPHEEEASVSDIRL